MNAILPQFFSVLNRSLIFIVLGLVLTVPGNVMASNSLDETASVEEVKAEWQGRYRKLLTDAARLRRNAEAARYNYSQANQRNYPRGAARKQFLIDEENAQAELVQVEADIEKLREDGRREGALPGWFYEVEDEPLDAPQPAAPVEDPADREGRNPLYLDTE